MLNAQPPDVRDVLLSTSILGQASGEAARELTGNKRAAGILPAVARANGFIQPLGSGWYRYHPLFADVLRLKLSRENPDRVALPHRRAARWYERNGQLADAVRCAAGCATRQPRPPKRPRPSRETSRRPRPRPRGPYRTCLGAPGTL